MDFRTDLQRRINKLVAGLHLTAHSTKFRIKNETCCKLGRRPIVKFQMLFSSRVTSAAMSAQGLSKSPGDFRGRNTGPGFIYLQCEPNVV